MKGWYRLEIRDSNLDNQIPQRNENCSKDLYDVPLVTAGVLIQNDSDLDNSSKLLEHLLDLGFPEAVGDVSNVERSGG